MEKKKDKAGLIFSAFLIIAFVLCAYFFIGLIFGSSGLDDSIKRLMTAAVFALFGLILFYATRVGDGKQVKRFSPATLIILDLPALYILLASAAQGLPFPLDITARPEIIYMAGAALGYGLPYTFLSGYEQDIPVEDKSGLAEEKAENEEYEPDELDDIEDEVPDEAEISDVSEEPAEAVKEEASDDSVEDLLKSDDE